MERLARRVCAISPSQTLAIGAKAKEMRAAGENVISFSVGEPDFDTPAYIADAAREAIASGKTRYTPAAGIPELRRAVCEKFLRDNGLSYEPSQIVVSNGAKHSVFNACFALLDEGDEAVIPAPYWLTYPETVKLCGAVPVIVRTDRENAFKITPAQLRAAITPRTKLFIFNSPCNPTGAVYSEEEVRALGEVCAEAGIFVLSDEIYEKLVYDGAKPFPIARCPGLKERTVTVNGVSKTYAMTGWRIGYLAAPHDVAAAVSSFQSHATSNPNSIAQYAALKALTSPETAVEEMASCFAARRAAMLGRIADMQKVRCIVPQGAFYVMLIVDGVYGKRYGGREIRCSADFADILLEEEKVAVVPGSAFGADDCVRLSYSLSMEEMLEGLGRIGRFLQNL